MSGVESFGAIPMVNAKPKAFTLVELLVVIAIVTLLVAVLLPSLANARKVAKRSMCGNNLRQFAIALNTYAGDSHDWLPSHSTDDATYNMPASSGPGGYIYQISATLGQPIDDASSPWMILTTGYASYPGGGPRVWAVLINPGYIIDWRILYCPDAPTSINGNPTPMDYFKLNQMMTYRGFISGKVDDPHRAEKILYWWEPRRTLLIDVPYYAEFFGGGYGAGANHASPGPTNGPIYGTDTAYEGMNFLGVDGAVRWQSEQADGQTVDGHRILPY